MSTGEVRSDEMDVVERKRCLCRPGSVETFWLVDVEGAITEADEGGGSSSKSAVADDGAVDEGILG